MSLFILICRDAENGLQKRLTVRPAHLDHIAAHGEAVKMAGPLLDDEGNPVGSLFLLEMEDRKAVETFAEADPYNQNGIFASREIRGFNIVVDGLSK